MKAACGDNHSVCISGIGTVWGFGDNSEGQVAAINVSYRSFPTINQTISDVVSVSCGNKNTFALTSAGVVMKTKKYNPFHCIEVDSPIRSISAGRGATFAYFIDEEDDLWAVGEYIGRKESNFNKATKLTMNNIKSVACGRNFVIVQNNFGSFYGAGDNTYGQLGLPKGKIQNFTEVPALDENFEEFCCGDENSLFLDSTGNVYYLGHAFHLKVSLPVDEMGCCNSPSVIPGLKNIKKISCGGFHFHCIDYDEFVYICGVYENLEGNSNSLTSPLNKFTTLVGQGYPYFVPTKVEGLRNVSTISSGGFHTILKADGEVYAIGRNTKGELGIGRMGGSSFTPVKLQNPNIIGNPRRPKKSARN